MTKQPVNVRERKQQQQQNKKSNKQKNNTPNLTREISNCYTDY